MLVEKLVDMELCLRVGSEPRTRVSRAPHYEPQHVMMLIAGTP